MPQVSPPRWSEDQLNGYASESIQRFREHRMHEPLEQYLEQFDTYRDAVENLIEGTVDLTQLADQAVELLTEPGALISVRYLASPAISEDDLKVLAEAKLTPTRLREDEEMARRIINTVLLGLDRNRFPWVSEDREATDAEREAAVIATAALIATQKVQTQRRNDSKQEQEDGVAETLKQSGFTQVSTRAVHNVSHLPEPGQFCREAYFGSRKADLIVRLWDGRAMPLECKVSNSSTNSVKRLNNDAAVKAGVWLQEFGTSTAVPAAVLSGVFKIRNLESAQTAGLALFWAHRLDAMTSFIEDTRP